MHLAQKQNKKQKYPCACALPCPPDQSVSILSPSTSTSHALIKTGHRLIRTSDLDLEESGFFASASFLGALDLRLVRIVPGSGSTEDIFSLLSRKLLPLVV